MRNSNKLTLVSFGWLDKTLPPTQTIRLRVYPPKSSMVKRKNQIVTRIIATSTGNQIAQLIIPGSSSSLSVMLLPSKAL
jgi:hypothetical protein